VSGYALGIDAGGTSTVAVIADGAGRVVGEGRAGAANPDDVGADGMAAALRAATEAARSAAGVRADLETAFLGVAGVISEDDRALVRSAAAGLARRIEVDHDCRIALAGGLSGRPGIVLIAGTGSSCYGRTAGGRDWRAGGWGALAGDEGGSYWLGVGALRAAVRSADGRGPRSTLEEPVLAHLGLTGFDELLGRLHVEGATRAEIAALAPSVIAAAREGDEAAAGLLAAAARELAGCVRAVAARLELEQVEVALVGGLFAAGAILRDPLEHAVASLVPGARLVDAERPPAVGAALLAGDLG